MQAPLSVMVCEGCWDLARDHFGSQAPLLASRRRTRSSPRLREGRATVGVLPLPDDTLRSVVADVSARLAGTAHHRAVAVRHGRQCRRGVSGRLRHRRDGGRSERRRLHASRDPRVAPRHHGVAHRRIPRGAYRSHALAAVEHDGKASTSSSSMRSSRMAIRVSSRHSRGSTHRRGRLGSAAMPGPCPTRRSASSSRNRRDGERSEPESGHPQHRALYRRRGQDRRRQARDPPRLE